MALADGGGNVLERYAYGDYGAPTIANAAGAPHVDSDRSDYRNPFLFNGRQYDETTGFYYYRTRYMEPLMGRFISRDTIGLWGDANNLGNPYTYAGNNPWTHLDPYGEGPNDRFGTDDYIAEATYTLGSIASGLARNTWAGIKGTGAGIYWWLFAGDEAHQEAALGVLAGSVKVLNDPGTAATSAASSAWAGAKDYGNSLLDTPASSGNSVSQAMLFAGGAAAPYAKLGRLTELGGLARLGNATGKFDDIYVLKRGLGDVTTSPWLADPRVGVRSHIESFRDGGSYLIPRAAYERRVRGQAMAGRSDGQFMLRKSAMDRVLRESGGDLKEVKRMLGIPDEFWNDELIRIDVDNPLLHNARMPSGLEEGANELFRWGGYTSGGYPEVVIDQIPAGAFRAVETGIGP